MSEPRRRVGGRWKEFRDKRGKLWFEYNAYLDTVRVRDNRMTYEACLTRERIEAEPHRDVPLPTAWYEQPNTI